MQYNGRTIGLDYITRAGGVEGYVIKGADNIGRGSYNTVSTVSRVSTYFSVRDLRDLRD